MVLIRRRGIMEEDEEVVEEKETEADPLIMELAARNKVVLSGNPCCPGCGCILALKLALQVLDMRMLVLSQGCIGLITKYPPAAATVRAGMNAAAVAAGISRSLKEPVLVYAGDGSTRMNLSSIFSCAERDENILYVCYNNLGYCNIGSNFVAGFAASVNAKYSATASVSHLEDYIRKLKKASQISGFRFLEVLCPCPVSSGFDASNTIEVARVGVESGFWPLYEVQNRRIEATYKPSRLETVDRFFGMQSAKYDKDIVMGWVNSNWKMLKWV